MKCIHWVSLLLLSLCSQLQADLVIVQQMEGAGQSGQMTVKFHGDLMRADVSDQLSTVTNTSTGEILTILHAQKSVMRMNAEQTRAIMEAATKTEPAGAEPPKLIPTGEKQKINGYDTERFKFKVGEMEISYWLAKDFPNFQSLVAQMLKMQSSGLAKAMRGMSPAASDFTGMPLRTEINVGGQKMVSTVVSIEERAVSPSEFEVPAGYNEMKMPAFN